MAKTSCNLKSASLAIIFLIFCTITVAEQIFAWFEANCSQILNIDTEPAFVVAWNGVYFYQLLDVRRDERKVYFIRRIVF